MEGAYIRKRDFIVCGIVGVCATTREQFVNEAFNLPVEPVSATINLVGVPAIVSAKENPVIAEMYNKATMVAIDGMPIVKIGRRKGFRCDRCAAPDIMALMFRESIKLGKTHYFYGGNDEGVLKKLKENLERDFPDIKIVGMYSPPFRALTEEEDEAICDQINRLRPDFLWVGIGAPKQEMWMLNHQSKLQGCIMLGVGAGFNFFAGTLEKAPEWMEKASLEWFFRLCKEPKRLWRRYLIGGFKYIYFTLEHSLKSRNRKG